MRERIWLSLIVIDGVGDRSPPMMPGRRDVKMLFLVIPARRWIVIGIFMGRETALTTINKSVFGCR